METAYVHQKSDPRFKDLGGKAARLHVLSDMGLSVPAWITLLKAPPASEIEFILKNFFPGVQKLAVRSSARCEDSKAHSFAGMFKTFLNVTPDQVAARVQDCFASAHTPSVLDYASRVLQNGRDLSMQVVIQAMVDSHVSGIAFSQDPTGKNKGVLIHAGYGLGEGVVSNQVEVDEFVFQGPGKIKKAVRKKLKMKRGIPAADGEISNCDVPLELQEQAVLTDSQIDYLGKMVRSIEAEMKEPQDVEWCTDSRGEFYFLQARPITRIQNEESFMIDNGNICESFPGVSSPMTQSVAVQVYAALFNSAAKRLGFSESMRVGNPFFEKLVHVHEGRIFYNLTNWYGMMQMIPFTGSYIKVWDEMLGLDSVGPGKRAKAGWLYDLALVSRIGVSLVRDFIFLGSHQRNFYYRCERFLKSQWVRLDIFSKDEEATSHSELLRQLRRITNEVFDFWQVPLINDVYAFVFCGLLKRSVSVEVFNQLFLGVDEMKSLEPLRRMEALLDRLEAHPETRTFLREAQKSEVFDFEALRVMDAEFARLWNEYVYEFGDRGIAELKLETLTLRDNPFELVHRLLNPREQQARHPERKTPEAILKEANIGGLKRLWVQWCFRKARESINFREGARLMRSRVYGVMRSGLLIVGRNLVSKGFMESPRDVFFLSLDEALDDRTIQADQRARVLVRKTDFERQSSIQVSERYHVAGGNYYPVTQQKGTGQLKGTGCSEGLIEAGAIVFTSLKDAENRASEVHGKILVTVSTDPGWVFLMTRAAGLIVEKGSILSHTAIIGRELGIPTIVGVNGATSLIRDGEKIRMNASSGMIEHL